jgi:hypothetical protein
MGPIIGTGTVDQEIALDDAAGAAVGQGGEAIVAARAEVAAVLLFGQDLPRRLVVGEAVGLVRLPHQRVTARS